MWALTEVVRARQAAARIGRFDVSAVLTQHRRPRARGWPCAALPQRCRDPACRVPSAGRRLLRRQPAVLQLSPAGCSRDRRGCCNRWTPTRPLPHCLPRRPPAVPHGPSRGSVSTTRGLGWGPAPTRSAAVAPDKGYYRAAASARLCGAGGGPGAGREGGMSQAPRRGGPSRAVPSRAALSRAGAGGCCGRGAAPRWPVATWARRR